jgi:hypothetical protein
LKERINFLDLEGTVIGCWNNPQIINHDLKCVLSNNSWHIFSFALCTKEDKDHFEDFIKEEINFQFNCKIHNSILMDDITKQIAKMSGITLFDTIDIIDFRNTLGKKEMFLRYIKMKELKECEIYLIDDMVDNEIVIQKDLNNIITFIKVE